MTVVPNRTSELPFPERKNAQGTKLLDFAFRSEDLNCYDYGIFGTG